MSASIKRIGGVTLFVVMFAANPLYAGKPKDVNVVNVPDVHVVNEPSAAVPVVLVNEDKAPIPIISHLGVKSDDMIALGGVDCPGVGDEAILRARGTNEDYFVPEGKNLVITDFVISPQSLDATGLYAFQILPNLPFTTALISVASTDDWSSFRLNFTAGMVFNSGSTVRFLLNFGPGCAEISAFGYLAEL